MLLNSYGFILAFLPVVILAYFLMGKASKPVYSKIVLLVASYFFIVYLDLASGLVLFLSSFVNYFFNRGIKKNQTKAKGIVATGVVFNIILLCFFKYIGLLIERIGLTAASGIPALKIILPIGISFYSFQQIAFLIDNYRGEVADYSFLDYLLFTSYFPKVIQGPINYHSEFIPQLNSPQSRMFNFDNISAGLMTFAIGLSKKVLVADNLGKIVDYGYTNITSLNSFEAILVILGYTLQIYFDFSGYCDMAIGVSKMLNIDLPVNFDSPYKACNISDFWKRWHITLTRFLTKYLYIPLGGNRKGTVRTYINILIVFLVSGIWHGVGLTFIVWGLIHGSASIIYRMTMKTYDSIPRLIQWFLTFIFINLTWIVFRAGSMSDALSLLGRVFAGGFGINAALAENLLQPTIINVLSQVLPLNYVTILLFVISIVVVTLLKNSNEMTKTFRPTFKSWAFTLVLS